MHRGVPSDFKPPRAWRVLTFAGIDDTPPAGDVAARAENALNSPVRSSPLQDRVSASSTVTILIEDLTRASPKAQVLGAVLAVLNAAGVQRDNIAVVIALGTHRGLTTAELERAFGRDLVSTYRFMNHDCHAADLVPAGRLPTGQSVRIHPSAHEADVTMGIGSIFPHPMNGFGGGGKILFPGVADFDSILAHHFTYTFQSGTGLGKIEANPFYESVCDMARSAGLDFIVNSILDRRDNLFDVVAGDPVHAHLAGIKISKSILSQPFHKKADLTLTTSFPYTEGPQIVKALAPASMVTKEGGCIILSAECDGTLPEPFVESFERFHRRHGADLMTGVLHHFNEGRLIMDGGAIDYNMALGMTLAIMHRFKVILVSEDIPRETGTRMGFIYAGDLKEAFDLAGRYCSWPDVHIIPAGGVTLPMI
ncbi:MAG: lactate racemase domain-containing protein [Deltaproteobacteria bacterium]|nr:lactate racemase domain-containing protein [Deltaproteobacteria bacterium]